MMAAFTRICALFCAAALVSSASPVPPSTRVAVPGQNVSLSCTLTSCGEVTWYLLRSNQLQPLLTAAFGKITPAVDHHAAADRRRQRGAVRNCSVDLEVLWVEEEDAGVYFCSGRGDGKVHFSRGIHLSFQGADGEAAGQPCWSLGIYLLLASLTSCLVFIAGLLLRSGKPTVCCCRNNESPKVTEDMSVHYSSLKHEPRPRPSNQGQGSGLVREDVIYSTVGWKNPNCSNHR